MWAKQTDAELIEQSDIIVTAELIGHTQVTINHVIIGMGALKVAETLKGDKEQTVILLKLPLIETPHSSTDIFYKKGQSGLWFLRELKREGFEGIYLANHPQSFISIENAGEQIKVLRKGIKNN